MKDKELLSFLLKNGWKVVRTKGSHHQLKKEGFEPVTVAVHGKDMPKGLELSILKQAGLKK
jgi:mRNA interferase HicA